ncbi:hypothetical protein P2G88_07695 [Aliiglaciecola sp. CAU 1673]|uniref:hypothetical protein n=1 Tax=Aliiglaciecola sp. CAU 1673 TaxID=3032595 RepID=UPI0023DB9053|nr:hypothetical protein [Aliiglaciecola sp. CAU 1673]MDF2178134.1 hypothetical protein [Aliiglaciecola sp. CAU 1673]
MPLKKSKILLFATCLFSVGVSSSPNDLHAVEAYRHMVFRASPYAELKGRYPVQPEEIAHGSHYRFYRDDSGRVIRIEHWLRNHITDGGYPRFGAIGGKAVVEMEYADDTITRRYFNANMELEENFWGVAVEEFRVNENGHRVALIYKDVAGNRVQDSRGVWETTWQVSDNGRTVIEDRVDKNSERKRFNNFLDFGRVKMLFNEQGLRTHTWNIDSSGQPINSEKRQVAGVVTHWDNDTLDEKSIKWIDQNGSPKNLSPYDVVPGNYGFSEEHYTHDINGNIISLIKFDHTGKVVTPESNRNVFTRSIFDNFGFSVDHRYFNASGYPSEDMNGIARVEIQRDEKGLPLRLSRFGLNGELTESLEDGIASAEFLYVEGQSEPIRKFYDKQGQEVVRQ